MPDRSLREHAIGTFPHRAAAERAVEALLRAGFPPDCISVVLSPPARGPEWASDVGGEVGAGVGTTAGGAAGVLAGLGLVTVPGVGPLLAVGPLAAGLSGALLGASVGGLTGALVGLGIAEEEARRYAAHVQEGGALVAARCDGRP
jgi:hypothetical protein